MRMIYLIYVSSAVKSFTKAELLELLVQSREKNLRLGITGMLLYEGGNFMQVLEGDASAVRQVYDSIVRDPRHQGIILVDEDTLAERQFGDWSMGFRNLDDAEAQATPGFSRFMSKPLHDREFISDPTGCRKLLNLFRQDT